MQVWQSRFFSPDLDRGELKYYDGADALDESKLKGSLPLRHVEVVDRGNMFGKHCFSILTKEGKKAGKEYFLAASSNEEKSRWMFQLMHLSGLYLRLFDPQGPAGPAEVEAGEATENQEQANLERIKRSPLYEPCIAKVEANRICADCGAPNPTWAVHNDPFGVFVCIDCIGVHRGLWAGNCREVQLDRWPQDDIDRMARLGNERADDELEFHVPTSAVKPTQDAPRDVRMNFIKQKYVDLAFSKGKCEKQNKERQKATNRGGDGTGVATSSVVAAAGSGGATNRSKKSGGRMGGASASLDGPPRYTGVVYLQFKEVLGGVDVSKSCVIIANGFQACTASVPEKKYSGSGGAADGRCDVSMVQSAFPLDTLRRPLFVSFTDDKKTKVYATAVILASVALANVPEGNEVSATWSLVMPSGSKEANNNPTLTGTIKFETLA